MVILDSQKCLWSNKGLNSSDLFNLLFQHLWSVANGNNFQSIGQLPPFLVTTFYNLDFFDFLFYDKSCETYFPSHISSTNDQPENPASSNMTISNHSYYPKLGASPLHLCKLLRKIVFKVPQTEVHLFFSHKIYSLSLENTCEGLFTIKTKINK